MSMTEAQTLTLTQEEVRLWRIIIDFLEGGFTIQADAVEDALAAGSAEEWTTNQQQLLNNMRAQGAGFYNSALAFFSSLAANLAQLSGASNPQASTDAGLAKFHDYLIANAKDVLTRGFTKAAWSATGGNTGTGRIVQLKTDVTGIDADCGHTDSALTARCIRMAGNGVTAGSEVFAISGSPRQWPWQDAGMVSLYRPNYGNGINELSAQQLRVGGVGEDVISLRCVSGSSALNLVTNGDHEAAVTGSATTRIRGATIIANESNISVESTNPIKGEQSIKIDGNCTIDFPLNENGIRAKTGLAFGMLIEKDIDSSTLTGTLTLKLIDDGGTLFTQTITVGSEADNTVIAKDLGCIIPRDAGPNLRLQLEMASYADGSGTANALLVDEIYAARMYELDVGQQIVVVAGATDFVLDDRFTSSVSVAVGGQMQEFFNRVFGRYVDHDSSASTWVDPTYLPEIALTHNGTNVADAGTIALGSVATGAHPLTLRFSNSGPFPLVLEVPTSSAATNATLTDDGMTQAIIIMPNRYADLAVIVTDGGAGAFSITLNFVNNDSGENPFNVTISGTAT